MSVLGVKDSTQHVLENSKKENRDLPPNSEIVYNKPKGLPPGEGSQYALPHKQKTQLKLFLLPKTDLYKERKKHLHQRSLSDSLDSPTLAAKVFDDSNIPMPRLHDEQTVSGILKKRGEKLGQFLAKNSLWQENQNLSTEYTISFYIQANQLILFGRECDACLLCTCHISEEGRPKSHIFPQALLKVYTKIHCHNDPQFIYNLSDGEVLGAHGLSFPLFCKTCEKNASVEEELLKKVYLQVQSLDFEEQLSFENEKLIHQLKHILAILMFRGILLGINFLSDIPKHHSDMFYKTFFELRDYCFETVCEVYMEKEISKRIHLSLLPNASFKKYNNDPSYILDWQLRNPEFTSLVEVKGELYLYTKFDCFHCTLSIDPDDIPALKDGCCFCFYYYPNETNDSFPELLLNINLSRIETLTTVHI